MADTIRDNTALHRFELDADGHAAVVVYRRDGDTLTLLHTEVPKELEGRGIGSRLARAVFETLRSRNQKAVVRCPFLKTWLERHPEYADVVTG